MSDLAQGMNPGIRAPGAEYFHRLAGEFLQGLFNRLLNAIAVFLSLPADEAGTIVFKENFISRHCLF